MATFANMLLKIHENCKFFEPIFLLKCWVSSGAKVCKSCRTWKMLSNAYFLAKFGFDTTENEPAKILQTFANFLTNRYKHRPYRYMRRHKPGHRRCWGQSANGWRACWSPRQVQLRLPSTLHGCASCVWFVFVFSFFSCPASFSSWWWWWWWWWGVCPKKGKWRVERHWKIKQEEKRL